MHQETLQTLVRAVKESKMSHARNFVIARISELVTEKRHRARAFLLRNDNQRFTLLGF